MVRLFVVVVLELGGPELGTGSPRGGKGGGVAGGAAGNRVAARLTIKWRPWLLGGLLLAPGGMRSPQD